MLPAEVLAATYAELLSAPSFVAQLAPLVRVPADDLEDRVGARHPEGTALVELAADASSRTAAEELASAAANAFVSLVRQLEGQRADSVRAELGRRADELTRRVARLRRRGAGETDERVVSLRRRLGVVEEELARLASEPSLSLVSRPGGTAESVQPDLTENLLGGVLLGLIGGVGAALLPRRRREPVPLVVEEPQPEPAEATVAEHEAPVEVPEAPPSVSLLEPAPGTILSGRVALVARAPHAARVRFLFSDGSPDWAPIADVEAGSAESAWETESVRDGRYWLSAVATNADGLGTATDPIPVEVRNG